MRFILTGGQEADCLQVLPLLEGETAEAVLADKGYDATSCCVFFFLLSAKKDENAALTPTPVAAVESI